MFKPQTPCYFNPTFPFELKDRQGGLLSVSLSRMMATGLIRAFYRAVAKPIFFSQDPEEVHDRMCSLGEMLSRFRATRWLTKFFLQYRHPSLAQNLGGIHFENPVGLAAGFDKNARLMEILPDVGFGFEEVGSITGEPCEGNPKPRLWRLPKSQGLVVYYGLKNDGCEKIASRLHGSRFRFPVGMSVAKTNAPSTIETQAGIADYAKAFRTLEPMGDYMTVNVSCPNAFGGEPFTSPERLDLLLSELDAISTQKPVFLKLPADITTEGLDQLIAIADRHRVQGMILTNLTKRRDNPKILPQEVMGITVGGISGKPVFERSNALIAHLYRSTKGKYIIIGCGGIFSAEDAYEKIKQGASLVQLITGMIFEGPQLIGEINRGLVQLFKRDGFSNIREAIGSTHKKM